MSRCIENWQVMVLAHESKCGLTNCVPKITSFSLEKSAVLKQAHCQQQAYARKTPTPSTTEDHPFKKLTVKGQQFILRSIKQ